MSEQKPLTQSAILRFWSPLAATWLMMSVEGPFLAAVIARLAEPEENLAAYGVAFACALLFESPIILIMSASTRLVEDRPSFRTLRSFTFTLSGITTAAMAAVLLPPVFRALFEGAVGLPPEVAARTHAAVLVLLPWPAAIGYRRFYQGILIRSGRTRMVAYGTVVRLVGMTGASLLGALALGTSGAVTGAMGMTAGVVGEAVAARLMARSSLKGLKPEGSGSALTWSAVWSFYMPLALTSMLNLGVNPAVTFFLGQSRMALESLAAMPVVHALVFLFGSAGLAYQEVGIALLGPDRAGYPALRRFAATLGGLVAGALALVAWTPLLDLWLRGLAGLAPDLAAVATVPVRILALQPALTVVQSFQRALLVSARTTSAVTKATLLEVGVIVAALAAGIYGWNLIGATAAAAALVAGRAASVIYQVGPIRRTLAV